MGYQFREILYSLICIWFFLLFGSGTGEFGIVIFSVIALILCIGLGFNILVAQPPTRENIRIAVLVILLWGITTFGLFASLIWRLVKSVW